MTDDDLDYEDGDAWDREEREFIEEQAAIWRQTLDLYDEKGQKIGHLRLYEEEKDEASCEGFEPIKKPELNECANCKNRIQALYGKSGCILNIGETK